ncbi:MAG: glutamate---cysteine ligase / carboxylate-amine ligase, partial [Actinomycetota bacterium]|nr:glutamate---cysteine ligase / carboxylate-amine ligase [Actinomycetota bacterium]
MRVPTPDCDHVSVMQIPFHPSAGPSLGVEWELGLVDSRSYNLVSAADSIFTDLDRRHPGHRVHRELLLNTVELVTGICATTGEAMTDLAESMSAVRDVAEPLGIELFSAGMHPFASWQDQRVTASDRYDTLIDRTQWWGRQMLIYGIHMHVGMPNRDR